MKTIGLIGGTTWLSTVEYYKAINQEVNRRLGGHNSAKLYLYSLNFEEFKPPSSKEEQQKVVEKLTEIGQKLASAGAECLLLCANTPHIVADQIQAGLAIPLIHIADATAAEIQKNKLKTVALLGTKITMEQPFYAERLARAGIRTIIPNDEDRTFVHDSIYTELAKNIFTPETKAQYLNIINRLAQQGAEGVILGCTEIPILIKANECPIPSFDTTLIHAKAAVDFALAE